MAEEGWKVAPCAFLRKRSGTSRKLGCVALTRDMKMREGVTAGGIWVGGGRIH